VSAFWVWACVVEEIWGAGARGGLGGEPCARAAWSHGKLVAGMPGAATVGYAPEETEEGEKEFGVEEKKSEGGLVKESRAPRVCEKSEPRES